MSSKISIFATFILLGWCNPATGLSIKNTEQSIWQEYRIKAEFLYNILKFVSWPGEEDLNTDDWRIGVIADEEVVRIINDSLEQKRVEGRNIAVSAVEAAEDKTDYHVLFIAGNYMQASKNLIQELREDPVLVVGEVDNFASEFGIIGFVQRDDTLRLEINSLRAQNAGLTINYKLASLGSLVDDQS